MNTDELRVEQRHQQAADYWRTGVHKDSLPEAFARFERESINRLTALEAERAAGVAHLLIAEGAQSVTWGDGVLAEAAHDHGTKHRHPLDRIAAALDSCERSPDLFRKTRIHSHDSRGHQRVTRCFWLIGTPRLAKADKP